MDTAPTTMPTPPPPPTVSPTPAQTLLLIPAVDAPGTTTAVPVLSHAVLVVEDSPGQMVLECTTDPGVVMPMNVGDTRATLRLVHVPGTSTTPGATAEFADVQLTAARPSANVQGPIMLFRFTLRLIRWVQNNID